MTTSQSQLQPKPFTTTLVTCAVSGLAISIPHGFTQASNRGGIYHGTNTGFRHPDLAASVTILSDLYSDYLSFAAKGITPFTPETHANGTPVHDWTNSPAHVNRYLYLLAWLTKLPITFKTPANPETAYLALVRHSDKLIGAVSTINANSSLTFPTFSHDYPDSISDNLTGWFDAINMTILEAEARASQTSRQAKIVKYESILDPITTIGADYAAYRYAKPIAEWAALAGDFPKSVRELWMDIIFHTFRNNTMKLFELKVTEADLSELVSHCEDTIPHGTFYAHELMKRLRSAHTMIDEIMGHGAGIVTITQQTEPEPVRANFASQTEYLRAKLKWQASRVSISGTGDTSVYMDI